jgi:hypothetical protein
MQTDQHFSLIEMLKTSMVKSGLCKLSLVLQRQKHIDVQGAIMRFARRRHMSWHIRLKGSGALRLDAIGISHVGQHVTTAVRAIKVEGLCQK